MLYRQILDEGQVLFPKVIFEKDRILLIQKVRKALIQYFLSAVNPCHLQNIVDQPQQILPGHLDLRQMVL